jgi:glutamyl-tRNA(Gln) amidotransferase subunit E
LHITRKQYLDGSIPTGFQRTAIVGIEGEIPLSRKTVRIIQISIEEDSCREVSDVGHTRVYTTDRLGLPLIESVTYPDMLTPDEVAEAAQYLRLLVRSTDKVRTGMGAAREDVNVSITDGTRVEIKGVAHIRWIPRLTHNEAFRQKALLLIRDRLTDVIPDQAAWEISHCDITDDRVGQDRPEIRQARRDGHRVVAVNLPKFAGVVSHFTQPGQCFAHELSDRLKVIACLNRPNMVASEGIGAVGPDSIDFADIAARLGAGSDDAQVIFWGPADDVPTALETIEERCRLAFAGVPNETRKSLADGTTIFERVLPGPDRMYPDTDSAPIPIEESFIEKCRANLPRDLDNRWARLREWQVPGDLHVYMLRHRLVPVVEWICREGRWDPRFVSVNLSRAVRRSAGDAERREVVTPQRLQGMFEFLAGRDLGADVARDMLDELYQHATASNEALLERLGFQRTDRRAIIDAIPGLIDRFKGACTSHKPDACVRWVMGQLRDRALGNIALAELADEVRRSIGHE